jgi:hypothetical protein
MAIQHLSAGAAVTIDGTVATSGASTVAGTVAVSSIAGGTVAVSGLAGTSSVALTAGGTVAVTGVAGTSTVVGAVAVTTPLYGWRASDGSAVPARIDGMTFAMQGIDYAHHEIHNSSHFFYANPTTLGSAATKDYLIVTPNSTTWAHMLWKIDASAIAGFIVIENTDLTGTAAASTFNSNRNSAGTATTVIYADATGTLGGTRIWSYTSGASTNQSSSIAASRSDNELILKANTKYGIHVTSYAADNLTNFIAEWYEHVSAV